MDFKLARKTPPGSLGQSQWPCVTMTVTVRVTVTVLCSHGHTGTHWPAGAGWPESRLCVTVPVTRTGASRQVRRGAESGP
jgi:hypothetical protein